MNHAHDQRLRHYTLIPFVVLGILGGVYAGVGFGLGMHGEGAATRGNPAALAFFVVPPMVFSFLGWVAYRIARRFARTSQTEAE
jgi:hypothetical protein